MGRNKTYPREQEVTCAVCGVPGVRTVTGHMQMQNLWYCCEEHRAARRALVRRGDLPISPLWAKRRLERRVKKAPKDIKDIPVSKHAANGRRPVESIAAPTAYERQLWGR